MSVAYCVMAHGSAELTTRLVNVLLVDDRSALVILHQDPRGESIVPGQEPSWDRVRTIRPRPVHWGSFDLVDVGLDLLEAAMAQPSVESVVLMSGQDYPARSLAGLADELAAYDVWMEAFPSIEWHDAWPYATWRYGHRWIHVLEPTLPARAIWNASRLLRVPAENVNMTARVARLCQREQFWWGVRRKLPSHDLYAGSNWMSLSRRAVLAILDSRTRDRKLWRYFRSVPVADELAFATVLRSAPGLRHGPGHRRYIVWPGPKVLTLADLDDIRTSGTDFIRKVALPESYGLLTALDNLAERLPAQVPSC